MGDVRNVPNMVWADGSAVKNEVELQVKLLLGPKTEEDLKPPEPTKSKGKGGAQKGGKGGDQKAKPQGDTAKTKGEKRNEELMLL